MDTRSIHVQSILIDVPCRNKEVELLVSLLGEPNEPPPPSIFITGLKSSGKSFTVMKVLKQMKIQHAVISCIEGYTPALLFDPILKQFSVNHDQDMETEEDLIGTRCEDMMDFIQSLRRKASQYDKSKEVKRVIVLEEAEYLREMASNILPAFLKLRELSLLHNLCVILLTTLTLEKLSPPGGLSAPIHIYFPQYTQSQILQILMLDCPRKYTQEFYEKYLHLFISVFIRSCRDVRELRYKAAVNFSKFCEPIEMGKADFNDLKYLWQQIAPHFKLSLQDIYMRTELKDAEREAPAAAASASMDSERDLLPASTKLALSFELPYYAKYMLIAAYLASYNSHNDDKKLFVKLSRSKKKQMPKQNNKSSAKLSLQMVGPGVFHMTRLLAIFYAITEDTPRIQLSIDLLSQISTLVELQLLHKVGDDMFESPKFKCAVGLEFIIIIARTVRFNVTKYLSDYK